MKRTIVAPWRCVVVAGVLADVGKHARLLGSRALLMGGNTARGQGRGGERIPVRPVVSD